ncbi:MAG: GNAT family N-acetyltransferase [Desulfovibrionaceae bacterium]
MTTHHIQQLSGSELDSYESLVLSRPRLLIYHARRFLEVLASVTQAELHVFGAIAGGSLEAALPCLVKTVPSLGTVCNSLPFYGSNGGLMFRDGLDSVTREMIAGDLLSAMDAFVRTRERPLTATIIGAPGVPVPTALETFAPTRDRRIGQVLRLPVWASASDNREQLMARFHQKTRNALRKPYKSGISCTRRDDPEAYAALRDFHAQTMAGLGGTPKPAPFFEALLTRFAEPERPLYVATQDGRSIAALLVLRYNRTCEYYIPATAAAFRAWQPMSMLVFESMLDAMRDGYAWYNFGGTWLNQDGVHRFKARWGAEDIPYDYYIRAYATLDHLRTLGATGAFSRFPYFYIFPYHQLEDNHA